MLSDEEKREYEELKSLLYTGTISQYGKRKLIDIIEKQSKEIEHQKEKRENQKKELAILNAKQIEFNKLVNTVNSYKGQFKRQQKEIEELKEKNRQSKMRIVQLENEITARIEDVNQYYTPNDKIKAKIEPVLKQLDIKMKEEYNKYGNSREYQDIVDAYNFLQSLLEKE